MEEENKENQEPDYKAKSAELEAKLTETAAELEKLKGKGANFAELRKMTDEEISKRDAKIAELESSLKDTSDKMEAITSEQKSNWKGDILSVAVGSDASKLKEVESEYALLNMPEGTREEVKAKTLKALKLAGYELKGDVTAISFGSGKNAEEKKDKLSDNTKAFLNNLFPNVKYDK